MNAQEQTRVLQRNTTVVPVGGLEEKLKQRRPLLVKFGLDPTSPDIHLGHVVVLRKLRQFQDLGHKVVLIVGDFTAKIGDPSGRSQTRPMLSDEEIKKNAATYKKQATKLLDSSSKKLTIRFNSEWLGKLNADDMLRLVSRVTVAQMLARRDFRKRLKNDIDINTHEFIYPVLQAYDSVVLKPDVEIGGTDQLFNLLVGRDLMKKMELEEQVVMTMSLLPGLDGEQKMSKSLGNSLGVTEAPDAMFGKLMTVPDPLLESYAELVAGLTWAELKQLPAIEAKKSIAAKIVALFHGAAKAQLAQRAFEKTFQNKEFPKDATILTAPSNQPFTLLDLVMEGHQLFPSKSEARRKIAEGAVEIDGKKVTDPFAKLSLPKGKSMQLKIGKKGFYRIQ